MTVDNLEYYWTRVQATIKKKIGEPAFEAWFKPLKARNGDNETIVLEVPDEIYKNWLIEKYYSLIEESFNAILNTPATIEIVVNAAVLENKDAAKQEKTTPDRRALFQARMQEELFSNALPSPAASSSSLNAKYSFDSFVIGPSNRFAHAAAMAVAESPAKAYNPLFIYGGVGLGKTHLMQAIGHCVFQKSPHLKVYYMPSERFTNELIEAIQKRTMQRFRQRYRNVDILMIDDIQFIANKEATQEEFFHTFNTLFDAHKQIVISSDRPPKDIAALEKRLVSRFEWGLVTDIQPPNLETRMAILKNKVEAEKVKVPDDVLYFIASNVQSNIRELEGALIRVVAYANLENKTINLPFAKDVLKDLIRESNKNVNIEYIQKVVAEHFRLKLHDLKTRRRSKNVVYPRQIAMFLAREMTSFSLPELGDYFGGKDHTTILHACNKIRAEAQQDPEVKKLLDLLTVKIRE